MIVLLLLGLSLSSASGLAAPITGETQRESAAEPADPIVGETLPESTAEPADPLTLQDPAAPVVEPSFGGDADATVVEFSIVPSASDPNKMDTVIIVQQQGGKSICLNQSTSDIISRSYLWRGDAAFEPAVGGEIRGLSSGDSGELVGFNGIKVFIRPNSAADEFTDPDECFQVAEVEACFVADGEACDQVLQEGDFVCVGDGISNSGCAVAGHTNLMRRLRIMVALNEPVGETPIITEAGVVTAPELALPDGDSEEPGGEPPAGPAPEGPTAEDPVGGGGANQVTVPDVLGKTLGEASGMITGAGLVVGNVTTQDQHAGLRFPSVIRSAHAQHCIPATVADQNPDGGESALTGSLVDLEFCPEAAAIPEPPSLVLFAVGLGLLMLFTWLRRRFR